MLFFSVKIENVNLNLYEDLQLFFYVKSTDLNYEATLKNIKTKETGNGRF
jgi:hypothetical protein